MLRNLLQEIFELEVVTKLLRRKTSSTGSRAPVTVFATSCEQTCSCLLCSEHTCHEPIFDVLPVQVSAQGKSYYLCNLTYSHAHMIMSLLGADQRQ